MAKARIPSLPSRSAYGAITVAKPIPQLYGTPYHLPEGEGRHHCSKCGKWHYNQSSEWRHRGSCLSAAFEMVAKYQDKYSRPKSATLRVRHKAYPNDPQKHYFWNQATIHHFVWGNKEKLLELATAPRRSYSGEENGVGWIALTVSSKGNTPPWRRTNQISHLEFDDFWEPVEKAIDLDRIPIVSVKGMKFVTPDTEYMGPWIPLPIGWNPDYDEELFYASNKEFGPDRIYEEIPDPTFDVAGGAPLCSISGENHNESGHAMVISGYYVDEEGTKFVRLLDPAPSMRLRGNPYALHEPDPWALDPRNHVKWVKWDELLPFIRKSAGLTIFRAEVSSWDSAELDGLTEREDIDNRIDFMILEELCKRRDRLSVSYP